MSDSLEIVAHIHTSFPTKFGIPRQSLLTDDLEATIVFTEKFRVPEMIRGIESFSHLWLLWKFSENEDQPWSPTVRPPRLGGNKRVGVFATRAPFRPNYIGLSAVKLLRVEQTKNGAVLVVSGADLMDGTPIIDIKPYVPVSDAIPDAKEGFTEETKKHALNVRLPENEIAKVPEALRGPLKSILAQDPRPGYQRDPLREYGFFFDRFEVKFTVDGDELTVKTIIERENG